jgi:hypothetical protein
MEPMIEGDAIKDCTRVYAVATARAIEPHTESVVNLTGAAKPSSGEYGRTKALFWDMG